MNPIISLSNYIKVGAIWLTDLINHYDPFELPPDYDVATFPPSLENLFWADINARFYQPTGEFYYQIPRPQDAGDTALFQGLATSLKILRKADSLKERTFIQSLFPNGALVRGYYADGRPNDTTSNDSATGMLFFFYTALWYGTDDERATAGAMLRQWVNHLKAHNWALCDQQGNPTTYGKLEDGLMTDPLRMTLLLALLSVAKAYDPAFAQDYSDLYHKYYPILAYPKVKLLWWDTDYDTHRAAIHLHVLYQMTKDEVYKKGLVRIWRISEKTQNAWVYTLCSVAMDNPDGAFVVRMLSTFDFNRRQLGNVESINDVPSVNWPPQLPFNLTTPKARSKSALPLSHRGSQEFFWQRCMLSKDEWVGNKTGDTFHSGLDFLLCGWLASRLGLLK